MYIHIIWRQATVSSSSRKASPQTAPVCKPSRRQFEPSRSQFVLGVARARLCVRVSERGRGRGWDKSGRKEVCVRARVCVRVRTHTRADPSGGRLLWSPPAGNRRHTPCHTAPLFAFICKAFHFWGGGQ